MLRFFKHHLAKVVYALAVGPEASVVVIAGFYHLLLRGMDPLTWDGSLFAMAHPAVDVHPHWVVGRPTDTVYTLMTAGPGSPGVEVHYCIFDGTDQVYNHALGHSSFTGLVFPTKGSPSGEWPNAPVTVPTDETFTVNGVDGSEAYVVLVSS